MAASSWARERGTSSYPGAVASQGGEGRLSACGSWGGCEPSTGRYRPARWPESVRNRLHAPPVENPGKVCRKREAAKLVTAARPFLGRILGGKYTSRPRGDSGSLARKKN